jgi:hypothetical protein
MLTAAAAATQYLSWVSKNTTTPTNRNERISARNDL